MDDSKKRMCWNCEGNIPLQEEVCPYCRASVLPIQSDESIEEESVSEEEKSGESKFIALTMGLLMGGSFFLLFSFLLFFFSNNGFFTLIWSDKYWYIYLFVSLPMLYFGWKKLQEIPD